MTQPTANWNLTTIDGVQMVVINGFQFRIPLDWDPSSNMFLAVAAPNGAVPIGTGGFPAFLTGPAGPPPNLSPVINFTELAATDSTPASASLSVIGSNLYQLNLKLHAGQAGPASSAAVMNAVDVSGSASAQPLQTLVVNSSGTGFVYQTQRVGDRYIPASIASCPAGNPLYTLCSVPVPAQLFDWRPFVSGQQVTVGTGLNVTVDVIARLSNNNSDGGQYTGNEIGRAIGITPGSWLTGPTPTMQVIESNPPPGSPDAWDRVLKGQPATIFFNLERQTGTDTFTSSGTNGRFGVRVMPCPTDTVFP